MFWNSFKTNLVSLSFSSGQQELQTILLMNISDAVFPLCILTQFLVHFDLVWHLMSSRIWTRSVLGCFCFRIGSGGNKRLEHCDFIFEHLSYITSDLSPVWPPSGLSLTQKAPKLRILEEHSIDSINLKAFGIPALLWYRGLNVGFLFLAFHTETLNRVNVRLPCWS